MRRGLIAAAAGCVVLAGLAALAILPRAPAPATPDKVAIGGPFHLIDGTGKPVTDASFRGRYMLIYFGYTHCPDACPTMLSDLASAIDKLPKADRARVAPIFITVDPARDTPALMGDYAQAFGPSFVGLTGAQPDITAAEDEYHVYAQKHPLKNGDYAMDHSSILYVMGPDGAYRGVIEDTKPELMAQQMQNYGV